LGRYCQPKEIIIKITNPAIKNQKVCKKLTNIPIIVHLSGCIGLAQFRQRKAKTKKKMNVKKNKIFMPISKMLI